MLTRLFVAASRIAGQLRTARLDNDFADEVDVHLDMLTDEYVRRGLAPAHARRAARLRLGGPMQLAEDRREQRGLPLVDTTLQDLRYACRTLRKHPGFSAVVILTLAIGIAAATSMFTVVRAVLLRAPRVTRRQNRFGAFTPCSRGCS